MARTESQVGLKATHVLFFVQLAVFLGLVVCSGQPWVPGLLERVALGDAGALFERPWTLLTYAFVNANPFEGVASATALLLAGAALEKRLGPARLLLVYGLSALLTGMCHVGLAEAGLTHPLFLGSVGPSAGLLTAYLFVFGHERSVAGAPFPLFYLLCAACLAGVLAFVEHDNQAAHERDRAALLEQATGEQASVEETVAAVRALDELEARRTDPLGHVLGLVVGGFSLLVTLLAGRTSERYRLLREIRTLQEEVDARARVELLLEKISREGIDSLTRNERKFLRYASRFYRSGRLSRSRG